MNNPLLQLREMNADLSPTEKSVADQILAHPELVTENSIHTLAQKTFASSATIVRLCRHLNFSGYREFRQAVVSELAVMNQRSHPGTDDLNPNDSLNDIIEKVTARNIASLDITAKLMDTEALQRCVDLLSQANVIHLFGIGASYCAAKDAYLKFQRISRLAVINEDWHSALVQAKNSTRQDVGIILSYSGATKEMLECARAMKGNGTPIIAITRFARSPIAELADERLYTASNEALFRSGAMASRIAQLTIIDILYTALTNRTYDESRRQISRTYIPKPGSEETHII